MTSQTPSAGKLIGVVFGTASHGVTMPGTHDRINGDFPGYAQTELERSHPGAQAMFLAGCGADANPYPKGSIEITRVHGKALAEEVARVLNGKLSPVPGPLRTELRQVDLPLRSFTRAEIQQLPKVSWQQYFMERALAILDQGGKLPEQYRAPFGLWQFGDALTLVAFSGETVVDYVAFTESRLGPLGLWVSGYNSDLFGYLPSARILAEGGYETRGLYMGIGLFDPKVQDVVMAAVEDMARAAGRKPKENTK